MCWFIITLLVGFIGIIFHRYYYQSQTYTTVTTTTVTTTVVTVVSSKKCTTRNKMGCSSSKAISAVPSKRSVKYTYDPDKEHIPCHTSYFPSTVKDTSVDDTATCMNILPSIHPFYFDNVLKSLKCQPCVKYDDTTYELLHTGGFLRLYTYPCRIYWSAQNSFEHRTPDWKFHFSVHLEDCIQAWNIIAALFIQLKCHWGMKICCGPDPGNPFQHWQLSQYGREITVYIYEYHDSYHDYIDVPELTLKPDQAHTQQYWHEFICKAEQLLHEHGIRNNGVADGDLAINNGKYVSIRNEAFMKHADMYIYPPNDAGWNHCNHVCPLNLEELTIPLNNSLEAVNDDDDDKQRINQDNIKSPTSSSDTPIPATSAST